MALVLIGFMGAGKSTVAGELAGEIGAGEALDSDTILQARLGHPVAEEFALNGEASFRAAEEALVCELLGDAPEEAVLALGGGSVVSERVREALTGHTTVLLDVDPQTAWKRVQAEPGGHERPLAADEEGFRALHADRAALYASLADAVLPELPAGAAVRALAALRSLSRAPGGTRMLWAHSASGDYPVLVGRGLLEEGAGTRLETIWPLERSSSRAFCVTDETVGARYASRIGETAATVTIAPGESNKTLASAERVWGELLQGGMTRADHVVAVGGGVVGDLAGFCAATYQRGVPVVQVPTTLVAQVDSAFGGKTGVDLPAGKNYVGVYHQPAGVIVDPDVLATLPEAELAAGWVEVLKTALIAGGELWEHVSGGGEADAATIVACIRTKLAVVAADERDGGRRQVLNLGHTVGHAIETATGYGRLRHGEAVGLGLLAALRLSGQPTLRELIQDLLQARGLPVSLPGVEPEAIMAAMAHDKKRVGERVPLVLVHAPGDVRHGGEPAIEDVRAAVAELVE